MQQCSVYKKAHPTTSATCLQDLTPLEIVLDKEPWMDEIPEEDMSLSQLRLSQIASH